MVGNLVIWIKGINEKGKDLISKKLKPDFNDITKPMKGNPIRDWQNIVEIIISRVVKVEKAENMKELELVKV